MNITILIKLLEAHVKKPILQAKAESNHSILLKQPREASRTRLKTVHGNLTKPIISSGTVSTKAVSVSRPFPPGKFSLLIPLLILISYVTVTSYLERWEFSCPKTHCTKTHTRGLRP